MFLVTSFPCHQYQRIFISKTELGQTQLTSWTNSFLCLNVNILSYPTLWWCQVWHVDLAIQTVTLCSPLVQSTSQQAEAAGFLFQLTISSHNLRGTRAKPDFLMPTPTIYIYDCTRQNEFLHFSPSAGYRNSRLCCCDNCVTGWRGRWRSG